MGEVLTLNAPWKKEQAQTSDKQTFVKDPNLFIPGPREDKKKGHTRVFFVLFKPGLIEAFKGLIPKDLNTFYFTLPVHYISQTNEQGNTYSEMVICGKAFPAKLKGNYDISKKVLSQVFGEKWQCPCCDEHSLYAKKYIERLQEIGLSREEAKGMSKEDFNAAVEKDRKAKTLRNRRNEYRLSNRELFFLLNYDALLSDGDGSANDDDPIGVQYYLGAETVFDKLANELDLGSVFYDLSTDKGGNVKGNIVRLYRDNTKGARFCQYDVRVEKESPDFNKEEVEFLQNFEEYPDPSQHIKFYSYDELAELAGLSSRTSSPPVSNDDDDESVGDDGDEAAEEETAAAAPQRRSLGRKTAKDASAKEAPEPEPETAEDPEPDPEPEPEPEPAKKAAAPKRRSRLGASKDKVETKSEPAEKPGNGKKPSNGNGKTEASKVSDKGDDAPAEAPPESEAVSARGTRRKVIWD